MATVSVAEGAAVVGIVVRDEKHHAEVHVTAQADGVRFTQAGDQPQPDEVILSWDALERAYAWTQSYRNGNKNAVLHADTTPTAQEV